ncbi:MAG: hypothetical protein J5I98_15495 [Phaeodactylibacter sp.]|nr:hypothetical protein [Phaeodactylibacter sp.]
MFNLARFALLAFALGILATPLLDEGGSLEEFALAMAEDTAGQDTPLALIQSIHPFDDRSPGPLPLFRGIANPAGTTAGAPQAHLPVLPSAATALFPNRPLYLLYHNFLLYDCLA